MVASDLTPLPFLIALLATLVHTPRSAAFSSEVVECGGLPMLIDLVKNGTDPEHKLAGVQVWKGVGCDER